MATRFTIQAVFQAIDRMTAPITKMRSSVKGLGNDLEKTQRKARGGTGGEKADPFGKKWERASQAFGRIDNRIRSATQTALIFGTTAGYGFASLVDSGANLEYSLVSATSKLEEMGGRGTDAYNELRQSALRYGETSMFSAQEVADSFNNLAQAGFDKNSMLALTPRLMNFAIAAETDLANASMMAGNAMGQFNLLYDKSGKLLSQGQLTTNMQRVSDVLAKTANMSNASIQQVYETMTESGAIADISGITLEKYAAMLAVLAQSGINASVAGTGLKNIFVRLKNPTSEGAAALAKYGISLEKFTDIKDPMTQFQALLGALDGQSDKKKQGFLDEYFGKIPLASAAVLFRGGAELVEQFHQGMLSSEGTTETIAKRLMDTSKAKLKQTAGVFKGIGVEMFAAIQGPMETALVGLAQWGRENKDQIVSAFKDFALGARDFGVWLYQNREMVLTLVKAFVALKVANGVIGTITDSFKILSLVGEPMGRIILGASSAATAIGTATTAVTAFKASLVGLGATAIVVSAVVAWKMAFDANEELKDFTGGVGIMDLVQEWITRTTAGDTPEGGLTGLADGYAAKRRLSDKTAKDQQVSVDKDISDYAGQYHVPQYTVLDSSSDGYTPQGFGQSGWSGKLKADVNQTSADGTPISIVISQQEAFKAVVELKLPNGASAMTESTTPGLSVVTVPQTGGI
jgi:TP901 family phage tail tape measure protein